MDERHAIAGVHPSQGTPGIVEVDKHFGLIVGFAKRRGGIGVVRLPPATLGIRKVNVAYVTEDIFGQIELGTELKFDLTTIRLNVVCDAAEILDVLIRVVANGEQIVGAMRRDGEGVT